MTANESRLRKTASSLKSYPFGLRTTLMELFDIGPWVAFTALTIAAAMIVASVVYFIKSAPPKTITISSGPEGSMNFRTANRYAKILERSGVKTQVLPSKGSLDNLARLNDENSKVDLGIVQTGPSTNPASENLVSLGSISNQPLLIFYRGPKIEYLSQLKGKRLAVGPEGSGTRSIALAILSPNGIKEGGETTLLGLDADEAAKGLEEKTLDAAFMMGENASGRILRNLMRSKEIRLFHFVQANAYARKFDFLNVLELPAGTIDLENNIPAHDVALLGPTVELIAKGSLHPALIDLLLEAATEVHSRPGLFQKRGEFPMSAEHAIPLSDDAVVYYKSGKSYLYRVLPFWVASLITRMLLVFLPTLIVLIPMLRGIPAFFRWIAQLKIRRSYRELRLLEQRYLFESDATKREALRYEFDRIDERVNRMKVRASFAEQFYRLRGHIDYVRRIVELKRV